MKDVRPFWQMRISSGDVDYLSETISRNFAPCIVSRPEKSKIIDLQADVLSFGDFSIARTNSVSGISYNSESPNNAVLCFVPITGVANFKLAKSDTDLSEKSVIICTSRQLRQLNFAENRNDIAFRTSLNAVYSVLEENIGRRIRHLGDFSFVFEKNGFMGAAIVNYANLMLELMEYRDLLQGSEIKLKRCRDAFISVVLSGFNKEQIAKISNKNDSIGAKEVIRAEEYMLANRELPIGVGDVAEHLGVTVRAVQYSFKRYRGITPLATLMRYRLEGLRDELLLGGHSSIAEVAANWGFVHPSRLSSAYRQAFGERPRDTVRRGATRR